VSQEIFGGSKAYRAGTLYKDAARRFKLALRDAARENMPLPKLIELGVISGTAANAATPQSEGTEYKPTKDAFLAGIRHAKIKGASTRDAIRIALRSTR
jgi:hypothetical protein